MCEDEQREPGRVGERYRIMVGELAAKGAMIKDVVSPRHLHCCPARKAKGWWLEKPVAGVCLEALVDCGRPAEVRNGPPSSHSTTETTALKPPASQPGPSFHSLYGTPPVSDLRLG